MSGSSAPITDAQKLELFSLSQSARSLSYSPYSKFRVGCAFLLSSGEFVQGANLENASYGGCICAERSAMCKSILEGKRDFVALAVAADIDAPCTPCGICRQFIRGPLDLRSISIQARRLTLDASCAEFCPLSMPIYMVPSSYSPDKPDASKIVTSSLGELLPMSFGPGQTQLAAVC